MGFGRILGYLFSVIWILASIAFLPISILWIWIPIVIIVVLRREAKREVRMEEYTKAQSEAMQKMANPLGLTNNQQEALDEYREKERKRLEKLTGKKNIQIDYRVVDDDTDKRPEGEYKNESK
jgi:hypothetical protein